NQLEFEEISTYPSSTKIIYKEHFKNRTQCTFIYNIQKEGIYPLNNKLVTTMKQKTVKTNIQSNNKRPFQEYKIPDNYAIITEWGHEIKHRIVYCQINYINNKLQFIIKYGLNFENMVLSIKSASH
ncbi:4989_t:CDS:1, partial [Cetraspora pellucida]